MSMKKIEQVVDPERNSSNELIFPDYPEFRPNLSPKEILQAGSFGGTYFRPITSSVTKESYSKMYEEFPADWFKGLSESEYASSKYNAKLNTYKKKCGGGLEMWEEKGWMDKQDPYGWFQWYCRFYCGRRTHDDARQVKRGLAVFGPKGRWRRNLINKVIAKGPTNEKALKDFTVSPVIRQLLQHWGYRLTLEDLESTSS